MVTGKINIHRHQPLRVTKYSSGTTNPFLGDNGVHAFRKYFRPKVNVIVRMKFEHTTGIVQPATISTKVYFQRVLETRGNIISSNDPSPCSKIPPLLGKKEHCMAQGLNIKFQN